MTLARAFSALALVALLLLAPSDSRAGGGGAPTSSFKSLVNVDGGPVFSKDAAVGSGWTEVVARVENVSSSPVRGNLELVSADAMYGAKNDSPYAAKAAFNLSAGASAVLRMPAHAVSSMSSVVLRATGEDGKKLAPDVTLAINTGEAPLLVDVEQTPRLSATLRDWALRPHWSPGAGGYSYGHSATRNALSTGAPTFDRATGDPILPDRAAAYSAVTALVIHSDMLARLDDAARDALVGWVLAGGTVAVVVARPEDMREGILATLAGGSFATADAPAVLKTLPAITRPTNPSYFDNGGATSPEEEDNGDPLKGFGEEDAGASTSPTPIHYFIPVHATPRPKTTTPGKPASTARLGPIPGLPLTGYAGGKLVPSNFGASAPYGLGEVHLLAFDPTTELGLGDGWVHGRMIDLVTRAWDRHATQVFPLGSGAERLNGATDVRRTLDPNENFRASLAVAAILLVIYSIVSGPITFIRAAKRGRPLDPLVWAPVWSVITLSLIVFIGFVGKGFRGRARHLALAEMSSGAARAPVRRFRGFFSSRTRALSIPATDGSCLLDVSTESARDRGGAVLRVDRGGASLENLTALPWQTVVVSEDGVVELKGGVVIAKNADGSVDVTNHTGRELTDVLVWVPAQGITFVASVKDGATSHVTGAGYFAPSARPRVVAGSLGVHPLDASYFKSIHTDDQAAWLALASSTSGAVDWFPDDVPVVMGRVAGGESAASDAELSVDVDRLLLRVTGYGGVP